MGGTTLRRSWVAPSLAAVLLIAGARIFVAHSTEPYAKILGLALLASGFILLGGSGWRATELVSKILILLLFAGYTLTMAQEYPGLLKEPRPYEKLVLLGFAAKALLLSSMAVLAVGAARWSLIAIWGHHHTRSKSR